MNTATLPSPHPYYQVITNNSCAYLVVHAPTINGDTRIDTYRIDDKGFKKTNRNPIGTPNHYWQDYCSLRVIQQIYFDILDSYRDDAEIVTIDHLRRIKDVEIPF